MNQIASQEPIASAPKNYGYNGRSRRLKSANALLEQARRLVFEAQFSLQSAEDAKERAACDKAYDQILEAQGAIIYSIMVMVKAMDPGGTSGK